MKKVWGLIAAAILISSLLGGCVLQSVGSAVSNKGDVTVQVNQSIALTNLTFTATQLTRSEGTTFAKPADGNVIVAVKFTVENTSAADQIIGALMLFDSYADNTKVLISTTGMMIFTPPLDGTLAAGKSMVGYHVVEVPAGAQVLTLNFNVVMPNNGDTSGKKFTFNIPQQQG
ncbi:MAG: DUF4352 domain-containing protein [Oscillospiraceae bacterium]|nr:DUF4352 domain-containing protein [Oscillospiraceae bacterium]